MEELLLLAFAASITLEILCIGKKKKKSCDDLPR